MSSAATPATSVNLFVYGHLMDPVALRARGLTATAAGKALLAGYSLRIGKRAYLVPSPGDSTPGLVYSVNASGAQGLFEGDDAAEQFATPVVLEMSDGTRLHAVTINVEQCLDDEPPDEEYAKSLCRVLQQCGIDDAHVRRAVSSSVGSADE